MSTVAAPADRRTTAIGVAIFGSACLFGGALIGHPLPLGDGVDGNDVAYMGTFPYAADPSSGFDNVKGQQKP